MEGPLVDKFRVAMVSFLRMGFGEQIDSNKSVKDCQAASLCGEQTLLADALFAWS